MAQANSYNPLTGHMWCGGAPAQPFSAHLPLTAPPIEPAKEGIMRYDDNGVPMYNIHGDGNYYYIPVVDVQYAFRAYTAYIRTKDPAKAVPVVQVADWLVRNQDVNTGLWRHTYKKQVSGTKITFEPGWGSAMAQGMAIALLARVAALKGPEAGKQYLVAAQRALRPFRIPVAKGGVLAYLDGKPWYEEYPTTPATYTLNGFIAALFGLYDLYALFGDRTALRLYNEGMDTLRAALPKFDVPDGKKNYYHLGHLTAPSLPPYLANSTYQNLHALQLKELQCIAPDPVIKRWQETWDSYLR